MVHEGAAPVYIELPPPTLFVEVPRDRDIITLHDFMLILFLEHSDGRLEPLSVDNTRRVCLWIHHPPTATTLQSNCVTASQSFNNIRFYDDDKPEVRGQREFP